MFATAMEDDTSCAMLIANKADTTIRNYIGLTASEIKQSREVKNEKPIPEIHLPVKPLQLTPAELISKSPHMGPLTHPGRLLSPQPAFFVISSNQNSFMQRKSSNASPSCFIATPHLTPIGTVGAMTLLPQVFFPSNFNPNVSLSPAVYENAFNNSIPNPLLNAHINPNTLNESGVYISPSYNIVNGFFPQSPCV